MTISHRHLPEQQVRAVSEAPIKESATAGTGLLCQKRAHKSCTCMQDMPDSSSAQALLHTVSLQLRFYHVSLDPVVLGSR